MALITCGNCKGKHPSVADVRGCYFPPEPEGDFEPDYDEDAAEAAIERAERSYERSIYGE